MVELEAERQPKSLDLWDYDVKSTIGIGSVGRVLGAKEKKSGVVYALKRMRKSDILKFKFADHIVSEVVIMTLVDHPFVVGLKGFAQDKRYVYIMMELFSGGDFYQYLREKTKLPLDESRFYCSQIAVMVEYLHSVDVVYRDLKPENLMISRKGYLRLIDFGLAKLNSYRTFTLCGTPEYLAPEILLNKGYHKPVDCWAMGVILYEMLVGVCPFNDDDPVGVYQKILKGQYRFPRGIDRKAKSLIKALLVADPELRFTASEAIQHKFFSSLSFESILQEKVPAVYIPPEKVTEEGNIDSSNFSDYPESDGEAPEVAIQDDPFADW